MQRYIHISLVFIIIRTVRGFTDRTINTIQLFTSVLWYRTWKNSDSQPFFFSNKVFHTFKKFRKCIHIHANIFIYQTETDKHRLSSVFYFYIYVYKLYIIVLYILYIHIYFFHVVLDDKAVAKVYVAGGTGQTGQCRSWRENSIGNRCVSASSVTSADSRTKLQIRFRELGRKEKIEIRSSRLYETTL